MIDKDDVEAVFTLGTMEVKATFSGKSAATWRCSLCSWFTPIENVGETRRHTRPMRHLEAAHEKQWNTAKHVARLDGLAHGDDEMLSIEREVT